MTNELPSPKLLRKLLRYELETGKLFWKERTPDMFVDGKHTAEHNCAAWNGRFANKQAFTAIMGGGYACGRVFDKAYFAHRVIWAIVHNEWPEQIDHINGVKDDNRIENLRSVSNAENGKNKKRQSNNASGVCGVYWHNRDSKWVAQIKFGGKKKHLGYFTDFDDAVAARKTAEVKHGFHPNHGRDQ